MTDVGWTIYTARADQVDAHLLGLLLDEQRRDRLFMESTTFEIIRDSVETLYVEVRVI